MCGASSSRCNYNNIVDIPTSIEISSKKEAYFSIFSYIFSCENCRNTKTQAIPK